MQALEHSIVLFIKHYKGAHESKVGEILNSSFDNPPSTISTTQQILMYLANLTCLLMGPHQNSIILTIMRQN